MNDTAPPISPSPTSTASCIASGRSPTALINLILTAMADKKLIIADGHHRYETSVAYAKERSAQLKLPLNQPLDPDEKISPSHLPAPPFPEAAMMMTFVNMDAPGITILPTHRVVFGLKDFSTAAFLAQAEPFFTVTPLDRWILNPWPHPRAPHSSSSPAMAITCSRPSRRSVKAALSGIPPRQAQLDVVQLHSLLLDRILGLSPERITQLGNVLFIREADEAIELVHSEQGSSPPHPPASTSASWTRTAIAPAVIVQLAK